VTKHCKSYAENARIVQHFLLLPALFGGIVANITNRLVVAVSRCSIRDARVRSLAWLVPCLVIVSGWALAPTAQAASTATAVSVSFLPPSIVANGTSTTIATATVTDATVQPQPGDTVVFSSSDTGEKIGATTYAGNNTYTATITSSTIIGTPTITAKDTSVTPNVSGTATLAQTAGPAATVTVQLNPSSIPANGTGTTTATATITDAQGHLLPSQAVVFSSSDTGDTVSATTPGVATGTYTATIKSSTTSTVGTPTITATDTSVSPAVFGMQTLTQTGPAASVTLQLSPSSISANGTATTTATATVTDAQAHLLPAETAVVFTSSDKGEKISATTNAGNGTYTATITSSTIIGTPTITATDGTAFATQSLNQTAGLPAIVTVHLNPSSIAADGTSTTDATATVTDPQGHPISTDTVVFASTDPGQFFGQVSNHGNGTYSVQIRSSTKPGQATITATDAYNLTGQASLGQTAGPSTTTLAASTSTLVTNETVTLFAAVGSATGSPSGTITFKNGGAPVAHCVGILITPSSSAATCQTSFAASTSTKQISAVFTPDSASTAPGSIGVITLTVKPDSTSVSLAAAATVQVGQRRTYTAVVTPPRSRPGPVVPSGWVDFLDRGKPIPSCLRMSVTSGRATCTLAYKARGAHRITAQYGGDPNFSGSASAARAITVVPAPVRVLGVLTPTMQWNFHYTPVYTSIAVLVLNGASTSATVAIRCHGGGCPFATRTMAVARPKHCGHKGQRACPTSGSIDLAPTFRNHRLRAGARLTVVISRPSWIGKYYAFTIRARSGPRIQITCVGPGRNQPGVGCST
jgi:Bacterial Ig-like domain (group 3)/Invasin, domain 3